MSITSAHVGGGRIHVRSAFADKDKIKAIGNAKWDPDMKTWSLPVTSVAAMVSAFPELYDLLPPELTAGISRMDKMVADACRILPAREIKTGPQAWAAPDGGIPFDRPVTMDQPAGAQEKPAEEGALPEGEGGLSLYTGQLPTFPRKPYGHQERVIRALVSNASAAVFAEMGLGKTQSVINAYQVLKELGKVKTMLVICPATLVPNWVAEIKLSMPSAKVETIPASQKKRLDFLTSHVDVRIINYEMITAIERTDMAKQWYVPDMVVLDESQRIKGHDTAITKAVIKRFGRAARRVILSGTPIQELVDIWGQYKFLGEIESSYFAFRGRYCRMGGYGNYQIVGYQNTEELQERINRRCIRLRKDKCLDLPDKIYTKRYLDVPSDMAKQYKAMYKEMTLALEGEDITAAIALVQILRLREITSGHYLTDQKDNGKIAAVREILSEAPDKNVIIWCEYRKSIDLVAAAAEEEGRTVVTLTGDTDDRQSVIAKFQETKGCVFVGQIRAGGVGINLTAGNIAIFFENSYSLINRVQAEDRCHRIGIKDHPLYIDLIYKGTIDEAIMEAIDGKSDRADQLVGCFKRGEYKLEKE